jgi:cardiolipin synthase
MEAQYETDLGNATEIVLRLPKRWRKAAAKAPQNDSDGPTEAADAVPPLVGASRPPPPKSSARVGPPYPRARGGSSGRAAGALRLANSVGAAIANRRVLGRTESGPLLLAGMLLLGGALIGFLWPRIVAWPLAVLTFWIGASLVVPYFEGRN